MIEIKLNLPEGFTLISIYRFEDLRWCVTLKKAPPHKMGQGVPYGRGEHKDIAEAARLAVELAERREREPNYNPPRPKPSLFAGLNLDDIKL